MGGWHTAHRGLTGEENQRPRRNAREVSGSRPGDLPTRRTAGKNWRLGVGNEHGRSDHFVADDLRRSTHAAYARAALARAPSRPPISAAEDLSLQLSLAVNSLRIFP